MKNLVVVIILCYALLPGNAQTTKSGLVTKFEFEENLNSIKGTSVKGVLDGQASYSKGLEGQALSIKSDSPLGFLEM